jgi:transglutaminase-like putative cysteine protease
VIDLTPPKASLEGCTNGMDHYLASSLYIDWQNPEVVSFAKQLVATHNDSHDVVKACFEFVRDEIKHSADYRLDPVTCKASEVLREGTGYCYAKSHLLAALLRANGIPTGLCYQRLTIDNDKPPFCLHGLNAVYLSDFGWYRLDARGNKQGVDAQFSPPQEKLAFAIKTKGEADLPEIWAEPLPLVVSVLEKYHRYDEVLANLPDLELVQES